jgi:exonuclease SbcC
MRPLELTLRGFQSYAGEHVFDFRDRSLLGVVGPIGSGKSSLLDGIAFALYGKTPRAGRNTRDLINQRKNSAHVELWFEVDGEVWRAVRALRKKGQSAHKLYRHDSLDPESEIVERFEKQADTNSRIEQLLGLDFDAFNRSVFLAQNRFAELLQATPGDRDAVLKGVFGFDRLSQMAVVAKEKRDGLKAELADLERLRREVETDRLARDEAGPALEEAAGRLALLDAGHAKEEELRPALAAADRDREAAGKKLNVLADLAAQLPAREQSGQLLDRVEAGTGVLDAARSALEDASARLEAARRHQSEVAAATGGPDAMEAGGLLLASRTELEKRLAELDTQQKDAAQRVESAREAGSVAVERAGRLEASEAETLAAAEEAAAVAVAAERAFHQAQHDSMALALRRELADGDTCPVCAQAVQAAPEAGPAPKLEAAEKALGQARTARETSRGAHTRAAADLAAARVEVESAAAALSTAQEASAAGTAERERVMARLAEVQGEIKALFPGDDPAAELEQRRRALAEAAAMTESAQAGESAARTAVDEARSQQDRLDSELVQLATTVATLAGQLQADLQPGVDPAELRAGLAGLRDLWEEANTAATSHLAAAEKQSSEVGAALAELLGSLGLSAEDGIADARKQAAAEHGKLVERMEGLAARISRFEELEAGSADAVARLATYETLAQDLLPARFLKFMLDEERRRLAELGSEHFERMTRGRYRFTSDGEFDVADLAAAETERRAESLSGGETFLASLSLALALAEMVSRTGGRLDAFFLDEGFGSLDPEHLDLAMEGIEALVGGNRLVAVVSHVPQLRERVEDLIELDNDPITGDTVVVRP